MIWAFRGDEQLNDFITKSLQDGKSRYCYSYIKTADLRELEQKDWSEMSEDEIYCYKKSNFLWEIEKGDWIVHINIPEYGQCTAGKVVSEYQFEKDVPKDVNDARHYFELDKSTIITFDRNDPKVHPIISRKLKLQGSYWRLYDEKEFLDSIKRLSKNKSITESDGAGLYYLKQELDSSYAEIAQKVHKVYPGKKLESFIAKVFDNVPNVVCAKVNGSGWKTDNGADIIVTYTSGILGMTHEETLVVQVKSYEGEHWSTEAVDQIKIAVEKYKANAGLIITTAALTPDLEKAVNAASNKSKIPISIIAGYDFAKFILQYGKFLFD